MSEKHEISLIVECDDCSSYELGHLGEQRGQHATNSVASHCVKIIHDQLGVVSSRVTMMEYVLSQFHSRNSKCCCGPLRQMTHNKSIYNEIFVFKVFSTAYGVFHASRKIGADR